MNWSTTNVRIPTIAAVPVSSTTTTANERGILCR
ncbi:Uncharacterised protein [Mycobacteroides abscessus subsp. abscessus]|nr:Uncharacterised protein [Mycobacteroides abscessus subsp. abscessus]SHZ06909.1 Uncharacterised protein [Mycobacteroides abscessus subsp. abscessus]SKV02084.1 Uncharacterised protein [Mycobacteroides abscessus subsp. abscessus]